MKKFIKEIVANDLPKEKIIKTKTAASLKTAELVSLLLGSGTKTRDLQSTSKEICEILEQNQNPTLDDVRRIKGVGKTKAPTILAAIELGKRCARRFKGDLSSTKASDIARELSDIRRAKKEHFVIFYLNTRDQEIKREVVSIGTVSASLVHPREVFASAIECGASMIIGAHNHPSGKTDPSDADIYITQRLVESGQILGIEFYDHIIVTEDDHLSIREEHPDLFD